MPVSGPRDQPVCRASMADPVVRLTQHCCCSSATRRDRPHAARRSPCPRSHLGPRPTTQHTPRPHLTALLTARARRILPWPRVKFLAPQEGRSDRRQAPLYGRESSAWIWPTTSLLLLASRPSVRLVGAPHLRACLTRCERRPVTLVNNIFRNCRTCPLRLHW